MEIAIQNFVNSDEGKAYFEKDRKKDELQKLRYQRFEKWLETNDFDKLLYKQILIHNDDYCTKCYHNGYEPMPNNVLSFIIDYISHNYESIIVNDLDCDFSNDIWFFKGYYFQQIYGQGVITKIFNKEDMRELLVL
jgi:hypothetical protein